MKRFLTFVAMIGGLMLADKAFAERTPKGGNDTANTTATTEVATATGASARLQLTELEHVFIEYVAQRIQDPSLPMDERAMAKDAAMRETTKQGMVAETVTVSADGRKASVGYYNPKAGPSQRYGRTVYKDGKQAR